MCKNVALVYGTLITGVGQAGCGIFCNAMGVSSINKRPYYNHCHFLFNNMESLLKSGSESILKVLQSIHDDEQLANTSDVDVALAQVAAAPSADASADASADGANDEVAETFLDVVVSYDGTWMTREHKSHICMGFVIHVDTGFVLDHDVVCNYCETCAIKKASLSAEVFLAWIATHTNCMQN